MMRDRGVLDGNRKEREPKKERKGAATGHQTCKAGSQALTMIMCFVVKGLQQRGRSNGESWRKLWQMTQTEWSTKNEYPKQVNERGARQSIGIVQKDKGKELGQGNEKGIVFPWSKD